MRLTKDILELLNGGDWACAYAQHETLVCVARQLGGLLDGAPAALAYEVADSAIDDLSTATAIWSRLAVTLRYGAGSFEGQEMSWNAES